MNEAMSRDKSNNEAATKQLVVTTGEMCLDGLAKGNHCESQVVWVLRHEFLHHLSSVLIHAHN